MKGLLIKDFKLMKTQKNYFLLILAITVGMSAFSEDVSFTMGFLTFVVSLFTISTISYDEFDNGNAFLFSLPITRTSYTLEKYALGLILGGGALVVSTLLILLTNASRNIRPVPEILLTALLILPVVLLIQAVMIPFQLKFGGERGRLAISGDFGLLLVRGVVGVKIADALHIDIFGILGQLPAPGMGMLLALLFGAALILLLLSVRISLGIMGKKEF